MPFRACFLFLLLVLGTPSEGQEAGWDKKAAPANNAAADSEAKARLMKKMDEIIIPSVHFKNATPEQALEFLRKKSRELDKSPEGSGARGVDINLRQPGHKDGPRITLDLKNVTLAKALLAVVEKAVMIYRVEATGVMVADMHAYRDERHTRSFKVPPDFLASGQTKPGETAPADPFAAQPTTPSSNSPDGENKWKTAQQILEAAGIPFPEKSSASLNPLTSELTVTNTLPNLDLVEAYVETGHSLRASVAYTLSVFEAPGELIREACTQASSNGDGAAALSKLYEMAKKPDSKVRVIGDAFLETNSGTRAVCENVCEHRYSKVWSLDEKGRATVDQETQQIGLHLEIEPFVGADGVTIETDLDLKLNEAAPIQRQNKVSIPPSEHLVDFPFTDIPGTQIKTGLRIHGGGTKLVGVTKPAGAAREQEDVLCAMFLTATVRRVEPLPGALLKADAPAHVPSGMMFAALRAPDALFDDAMLECSPRTVHAYMAQAGVSFPQGSVFEHHDGVLRCMNTPDNLALIMALVEQRLAGAPKTVALTFHTVEAPAQLLRDLSRKTSVSGNDAAIFEAVEAAAGRGEARFISSTFFESKPGTRTAQQATREHRHLESLETDAKGNLVFSFETRRVGSLFEVEPVVEADSRTIKLVLSHELHSAPPALQVQRLANPGLQQPQDIPTTDFSIHKTTSNINLTSGRTRLLSLNPPAGRNETGVLWATFVRCDVVPQVARSPYFRLTPPEAAADAKETHTRAYRVPPDFMGAGADASEPDNPKKTATAKAFLEAAGISFPPGTDASYDAPTSRLLVTNTNENLGLVEAYVGGGCYFPQRPVALSVHVLQGPGHLMRRLTALASGKSNHRAELDALLAGVKAGNVKHLGMARIETKSGILATSKQATQHAAITEVAMNEKGETFFFQDTREVGLGLELQPSVGADSATVDLTFSAEFHTAPPFEHREHFTDSQGRRLELPLTDYFASKLSSNVIIPSGAARLISLYKPAGKPEFEKEDILQAIFVTCDVLRPGE
ncbi:hypothetical protein [Prosthecobacter sp.]|uniref:hypothetical protein n=1 Tax=Prosthecobacter sp. TaxID=1965333 RepID=UPI003783F5C1